MDVSYPPEAEAFRDRIREFVAEHLPPGRTGPGGAAAPGAGRVRPALAAGPGRRCLGRVPWTTKYGGGGPGPDATSGVRREFARPGTLDRAKTDL
ncbi:acyl-CoA dehydrogenase fadE17, partial [Mycobacterium tuberculosis T85]